MRHGSVDQSLQSVAASSQEKARALDAKHGPMHVGEALPAVCYVEHVARVLDVTKSHVHKLRRRGALKAFLLPPIGGRVRYCGKTLQAWRDGTLNETHINGDINRPSRFGRKSLRAVNGSH